MPSYAVINDTELEPNKPITSSLLTRLRDNILALIDQRGAKAWVNFNGTGTVAIRDNYNVSSITDNGTGDYTINFTSALPNASYAATGMCGPGGSNNEVLTFTSMTTSALRVKSNANFNPGDVQYVMIICMGD